MCQQLNVHNSLLFFLFFSLLLELQSRGKEWLSASIHLIQLLSWATFLLHFSSSLPWLGSCPSFILTKERVFHRQLCSRTLASLYSSTLLCKCRYKLPIFFDRILFYSIVTCLPLQLVIWLILWNVGINWILLITMLQNKILCKMYQFFGVNCSLVEKLVQLKQSLFALQSLLPFLDEITHGST